ncbi:MAG: response regulator [Bryobacteraceae bacterium]
MSAEQPAVAEGNLIRTTQRPAKSRSGREAGLALNRVSSAPAHIFMAEDNPADVYLIRHVLKESGIDFQLKVAADGKQALSFLCGEGAFDETSMPALILLDLNLPKHDGTEILERIRNDRTFALVPVIILTSSDSPKDRLIATELGATCYLRKPSSLNEFMAVGAVIKEVLAASSAPAAKFLA